MTYQQLEHFLFEYHELKHKPITNFFNNEPLNTDNSNYHIYYKESDNFNILFNYIKFTSTNGASCDLLSRFFYLIYNDTLNHINDEDDDELYRDTEDISNILNIYNNLDKICNNKNNLCINNNGSYCDICKNNIDKIKTIYDNNPNIINDTDIKELFDNNNFLSNK